MIASNLAKSMEIATPPAPRGVEWLEVAEVEERSGIPARTLREKCPAWFAAGLAKMEKPADGGKAR